jgi:hypothetical protein
VQRETRADRIALLEPGLVEERRLHRARVVGHRRLDQRSHSTPAHGSRRDAADLHDHGGAVAGHQLRDRARLTAVARQVQQQVLDRPQPECVGGLLSLGSLELERHSQP